MKRKVNTNNWQTLPNEELVQVRIKDLNLQINDSELQPLIRRLHEELKLKNIGFRPAYYLADEWLCPDREPIIGIPFCLAHPRLKELERTMMYEVEGGDINSCIKLLRHECGHAINYAYQLYRRTRWRELFGPFSQKYSDSYPYRPYSRRFVIHLDNHYAQAHPDEDFAETFAVWLRPDNSWRQKYKNWPALAKLEYIDKLMKRISDQKPVVKAPLSPPWAAKRMRSTLEVYYNRKRNQLGKEFKGYYDDSLKALFSSGTDKKDKIKASKLLRRHRNQIVSHISKWTGHRKYDIHQLINRIIERCRTLDLYASDNSSGLVGVTTLITVIASGTHRIYTKGQK